MRFAVPTTTAMIGRSPDEVAEAAAAQAWCRSIEPDGDGYRFVADVRAGAALGLLSGDARPEPVGGGWRIRGGGEPGTLDVVVQRLDGGLTIDGDAGGPLAAIGSQLLRALAARLVRELTEGPPLPVVPEKPTPPAEPPGVDDTTRSFVVPPVLLPGPARSRVSMAGAAVAGVLSLAVGYLLGRRRRAS